jgi:hypothetical protein
MSGKVSIRIRYDRRSGLVGLLALALLVVALLGYLAWNQDEVAASGPQASLDHARDRPFDHAQDRPFDFPRLRSGQAAQDKPLAASAGLRGYYLTTATYNGADADGTDGNGAGVCADGYHFASLWEILDPSNLKYNTTLGRTQDDSGQGPPTLSYGWVRTGYSSNASTTPGWGNCNAWTSSSGEHSGTTAYLPGDWTAGQDIYVWEVYAPRCNVNRYVWCVADSVSAPVYLPIILKNSS